MFLMLEKFSNKFYMLECCERRIRRKKRQTEQQLTLRDDLILGSAQRRRTLPGSRRKPLLSHGKRADRVSRRGYFLLEKIMTY